MGIAPDVVPHDVARIGVEQQFGGIKSVPFVGSPGAMRTQAIHQARLGTGQVPVPDITGLAGQMHAGQLVCAIGIKKAEFDALGMARKHRKIDTLSIKMGPQGPRVSGLQAFRTQTFHSKIPLTRGAV